jgi:hypothetical protein
VAADARAWPGLDRSLLDETHDNHVCRGVCKRPSAFGAIIGFANLSGVSRTSFKVY